MNALRPDQSAPGLPEAPKCSDCGAVLMGAGPGGWCAACLLTAAADEGELPPDENPEALWAGRYRLHEVLGRGGFATVWRAEQLDPVRREVAIKVLERDIATPQALARFEAERQTLALMAHPGIAAVYDAGSCGGQAYIVMERVEGCPVTAFCEAQHADLALRLTLFASVAEAVQHAHGRGVIHRDLKPSNLLAFHSDGGPGVKVIDFGVARALEGPLEGVASPAVTVCRQMIGTPGYISPEQWTLGSAAADARSDVYALGMVLRELLTGERPAAGIPGDAPEAPALRGSLVSPLPRARRRELEAITAKAADPAPGSRYATAAALADDVRRFLRGEPVEAMRRGAWYLLGTLGRRHRRTMQAAALALMLIIGAGVFSSIQYFRAREAAAEAAAARVRAESGESGMRIALATADIAAGRQLISRGRAASAIPHMARAARLMPDNSVAAANLLLLLPRAPLLRLDARWPDATGNDPPGPAAVAADGTAIWAAGTRLLFAGPGLPLSSVTLPGPAHTVVIATGGRVAAAATEGGRIHVLTTPWTGVPRTWILPGGVKRMTLSPDGSFLAAGTPAGEVFLWETAAGGPPQRICQGMGSVSRLILTDSSPPVTIAGFSSGEVRRGAMLCGTAGSGITAMAAGAGGAVIAAGSAGGTVLIFGGTEQQPWTGSSHRGPVTAVTVLADGKTVVTAGSEPEVHVWREAPGAAGTSGPAAPLNGPAAGLYAPFGFPDKVLVVHDDGAMRLWTVSGGPLDALAPGRGRSALMAVSDDGSRALMRDNGDAMLRFRFSGSGLPAATLTSEAHQTGPGVQSLDFSGGSLFVADSAGVIRRWNPGTLTESGIARTVSGRPLALRALSAAEAVVALADGSCYRLTGESPPVRVVTPHPPPSGLWEAAALSPSGAGAAFARAPLPDDPRQPDTGYLIASLTDGSATALGVSPPSRALALDGHENLASGWRDGRIRLAPHGSRQGQRLDRHTSSVTAVCFAPDASGMVSGDAGGTLIFWQGPQPQPVAELPGAVSAAAFSPDGSRFAAACGSGIHVFDTASRQGLGMPLEAGESVTAIALNEDASQLAAGLTNGSVRLWHLPPAGCTSPAWLPDFAESWSGLKLGAAGMPEPVHSESPAPGPSDRAPGSPPTAADLLFQRLTAPSRHSSN